VKIAISVTDYSIPKLTSTDTALAYGVKVFLIDNWCFSRAIDGNKTFMPDRLTDRRTLCMAKPVETKEKHLGKYSRSYYARIDHDLCTPIGFLGSAYPTYMPSLVTIGQIQLKLSHSQVKCPMTEWLSDWLIDWLTDWLDHRLRSGKNHLAPKLSILSSSWQRCHRSLGQSTAPAGHLPHDITDGFTKYITIYPQRSY
jgi:hypothetical protein